jgi:hypothetical protein
MRTDFPQLKSVFLVLASATIWCDCWKLQKGYVYVCPASSVCCPESQIGSRLLVASNKGALSRQCLYNLLPWESPNHTRYQVRACPKSETSIACGAMATIGVRVISPVITL